ncbi:Uu.00g084610.m01.CDS01 [Anthostomella pinea]|uniref:Uu.00g084610.m01.CDS01 n=1 Tax=Anthostomella pinea TaxID=933095 RepID=A0AAI8YJQ2_9PEZI|nr:Uu.00g084610.m01.CDS01 [Anthostomella pinea]
MQITSTLLVAVTAFTAVSAVPAESEHKLNAREVARRDNERRQDALGEIETLLSEVNQLTKMYDSVIGDSSTTTPAFGTSSSGFLTQATSTGLGKSSGATATATLTPKDVHAKPTLMPKGAHRRQLGEEIEDAMDKVEEAESLYSQFAGGLSKSTKAVRTATAASEGAKVTDPILPRSPGLLHDVENLFGLGESASTSSSADADGDLTTVT